MRRLATLLLRITRHTSRPSRSGHPHCGSSPRGNGSLGVPASRVGSAPHHRRLFLESLEPRQVLSTFLVTTLADTVDADPAVTSLREAIMAANSQPSSDVIAFNSNIVGTINLTGALPAFST